jgi:hypothetical protein
MPAQTIVEKRMTETPGGYGARDVGETRDRRLPGLFAAAHWLVKDSRCTAVNCIRLAYARWRTNKLQLKPEADQSACRRL